MTNFDLQFPARSFNSSTAFQQSQSEIVTGCHVTCHGCNIKNHPVLPMLSRCHESGTPRHPPGGCPSLLASEVGRRTLIMGPDRFGLPRIFIPLGSDRFGIVVGHSEVIRTYPDLSGPIRSPGRVLEISSRAQNTTRRHFQARSRVPIQSTNPKSKMLV